MAVNKVEFGGETLIDLTGDTVTEDNLLFGATAHGADGNSIQGAVITHDVIDSLTSTSTEDALSANQGRGLKNYIDNIYLPKKTSDLVNDGDGTHPFLTQHQSLSAYRTSSAQDVIDSNIQNDIYGIINGEEWKPAKAYQIDEIVMYNNFPYRCKLTTTAGILPINTTYWERKNLATLINDIKLLNQSLTDKAVNYNHTYTGTYSVLNAVKDLFDNIPQGTPVIGRLQHYGERLYIGYRYVGANYGIFLVMAYDGTFNYVYNNNGTWTLKNVSVS